MMKNMVVMVCLVAWLGGCGEMRQMYGGLASAYGSLSSAMEFDAVSIVCWPAVDRPSPTMLYATPPATGSWTTMAQGNQASVCLDERLFAVAGTEDVYARMLVVNTTGREQGVLLHAEDVFFEGHYVLPPPAGAKLAVSEEEFAAGLAAPGSLPEQQVGEEAPDQAKRGVLVTIPPYASLEVYRRVEARRGSVGGAVVTVVGALGVVVTDGQCFERLAESAARDLHAPAAGGSWPQVPLGSLVLSSQGPARLVPSTQPNLVRPIPEAMPNPQ